MRALIKQAIKRLIYADKADSQTYVASLRKAGCKIGERVTFYRPMMTTIDTTRPWLIEIGDDVQITEGVTILTHGYDWSVLKRVYGDVIGSAGRVSIGNNVFIGMKTTILKGCRIGSNVIIGANSLVNKDIPDNCVAAGNPIKIVMTLEEYYEKRKREWVGEAVELVQKYRARYGREPDVMALREHFWLFSNDYDSLPEPWKHVMTLVGNEAESREKFANHTPMYPSLEEFLRSIDEPHGEVR